MLNRTPKRIADLATSLVIAGALTGASGAAVMAQDATPNATPIGPEGAACTAPAAVAPPVASPVTGTPGAATPIAGEVMLPAGPVVEDEAVIAEVTAAVQNIYTCFNTGDGASVVALFTENGRLAAYGPVDPSALAERLTAISGMVQAGDVTVNSVTLLSDTSYAVNYQVTIGPQVWHLTDVIVERDGFWLVDNRIVETPETELDSTTAAIKAAPSGEEMTFEVSPNPIANQPAVKFQIANTGQLPHNAVIFRVSEGFDPATLASGDLSQVPEGASYIGEGFAAPGEHTTILFENLEEGSYVAYCFVTDESGQAHAEQGMWVEFTIDPPFDPTA